MIKIKDLKFSYTKDKEFIKIDQLVINEKGIYSLIGENGSGKTTFLKLLCKILTDYEGEIDLFGREIKTLSENDISQIISYIPQKIYLYYDFPVFEFIKYGRYLKMDIFGNLSLKDYQEINLLMEKLEIGHLKNRNCFSLSGGEMQLVQLARAIFQGGKIIVMDEPFSNIDFRHRKKIIKIIDEIKPEKIILISSHDLGICFNISDKIIGLKNGKIAGFGEKEHMKSKLATIFETEIEFVEDKGKIYFYEGV
ncbi:MAG: ABC transporter ATP-binding protein [candidate division WOR-3 bacterium]